MNKFVLAIIIGLNAFIIYNLLPPFDDIIDYIVKYLIDINFEKHNDFELLEKYDFIIVGAGTAGCVLAARLSENPKWNVLLLEAGDSENFIMDIPMFPHYLQTSKKINWMYETEPSNSSCLAMENGRCHWPRGKVLGGSSVLNYMIYTRGNRKDFDDWAEMGNVGWSFTDVLPYFKKFENSKISESKAELYGRNGPVSITYNNYRTKIADAYMDAMKEFGLPENDYNGPSQVGTSYFQATRKNGKRVSSNRAYLDNIINERKNLHVQKLSIVTKIRINEQTKIAEAIEFYHNQQKYIVRTTKEIIISAGAINSPQLLMLSGVGPAEHLKEMRISTIANLSVGHNLMDHLVPGYIQFFTNATTLKESVEQPLNWIEYFRDGTGPITINGAVECGSFFNSANITQLDAHPDLEMFLITGSIYDKKDVRSNLRLKIDIYDKLFKNLETEKVKGFTVGIFVLRPDSRGRIKLQSTNPLRPPLIYPNYFHNQRDMDISIRGIRKVLELENTNAFKRINATAYKTPISECEQFEYNSDMFWDCFSRHFSFTIYHYSGTCKMGPINDKTAVVDPELRVIGIKNLRVADASIMPTIVSGHPSSAIFMIGEKAADMIKRYWD